MKLSMNTQEIMAELYEHKQEIAENLYDDEDINIVVCLQINYIESRAEVFKKYLDKNITRIAYFF